MDSHSLQLFVVWLLSSLVIPHVPQYSTKDIVGYIFLSLCVCICEWYREVFLVLNELILFSLTCFIVLGLSKHILLVLPEAIVICDVPDIQEASVF